MLLVGALSLSAMAGDYNQGPSGQSSGHHSGKPVKSLKKRDVAKFIPRMATAPVRGALKGAKDYVTDENIDWGSGDKGGERVSVKGFAKRVIKGGAGGPGAELQRYQDKYKAHKQNRKARKEVPFSEY